MIEIKSEQELQDCINSGYIIKFHAPWCNPCKNLHAVLGEIEREAENELFLASMDIDVSPEKCTELGIRTVPTVLAFSGGTIIGRKSGQGTKQEVKDWIESL